MLNFALPDVSVGVSKKTSKKRIESLNSFGVMADRRTKFQRKPQKRGLKDRSFG